jgi:hypothetical protein
MLLKRPLFRGHSHSLTCQVYPAKLRVGGTNLQGSTKSSNLNYLGAFSQYLVNSNQVVTETTSTLLGFSTLNSEKLAALSIQHPSSIMKIVSSLHHGSATNLVRCIPTNLVEYIRKTPKKEKKRKIYT